jgi:hypothetical protein
MDRQADFLRAKKVVNARIGFYIHLTAYLAVNALLVVINLATSTSRLWCIWPLLGWGVGVFVHALVTLGLSRGRGLKRRMIEREMRD